MIVNVVLPVPDGWVVGPTSRINVDSAEVVDVATGVIGTVTHAYVNWCDGRAEIRVQVDVTDAATKRMLERGSVEGTSF